MRDVLVVIDADPRSGDRALEALRMTVGLTLGASRLTLVLVDEAARLLTPEQEAFDDYHRARQYLEALDEAGVEIRATSGDVEPDEGEADVVIRWGPQPVPDSESGLDVERLLDRFVPPKPPPDADLPLAPRIVRRLTIGFYLFLIGAGLLWHLLRTGDWIPESLFGGDAVRSLLIGAVAAVTVVGLSNILTGRWKTMDWFALEVRRWLGPLPTGTVLVIAVCSGVGEEIFFRGVMQPVFGYVPTSLLFGLVHIGPDRRYLVWTAFAVAMGFLFGAILIETGSLLGPILTHVGVNALNLRRIVRMELPEEQ